MQGARLPKGARQAQRTDSTHVLGALRVLSRLELVAETMRAALNASAKAAPEWVGEHADPGWFERYSRRIEEHRLPKGKEARMEHLKTVGDDGLRLLAALEGLGVQRGLKGLPEVEIPRKTWEHQYARSEGGGLRVRDPKEMPEAARRAESPYETEARYSTKEDGTGWVGYKVHLTESCDDDDDEDSPNLVTNVETTVATATDVKQLLAIQEGLERSGLLPAEQLADAAYVCGSNLVSSRARRIELIGPPYQDSTWQAKATRKAST